MEIWNTFFRLETLGGTAQTIQNFEDEFMKKFNHNEQHKLYYDMQKFKFMDLEPCLPGESAMFGVERLAQSKKSVMESTKATGQEFDNTSNFTMPDLSQLTIYKPLE